MSRGDAAARLSRAWRLAQMPGVSNGLLAAIYREAAAAYMAVSEQQREFVPLSVFIVVARAGNIEDQFDRLVRVGPQHAGCLVWPVLDQARETGDSARVFVKLSKLAGIQPDVPDVPEQAREAPQGHLEAVEANVAPLADAPVPAVVEAAAPSVAQLSASEPSLIGRQFAR